LRASFGSLEVTVNELLDGLLENILEIADWNHQLSKVLVLGEKIAKPIPEIAVCY
jgi:hypothetical protein